MNYITIFWGFKMEIDYIKGIKTKEIFAMSKYEKELQKCIHNISFNVIEYPDIDSKVNIAFKYVFYPLIVGFKSKKHNVKHITSQDLAFVMNYFDFNKTVITCHDVIPWVYEKEHPYLWKKNADGILKADRLITVSDYSKKDIVKSLGFPEKNIRVIPPAIDHSMYYRKPSANNSILVKYGLSESYKILLYVGSERPRKNLPRLLESVRYLKSKIENVKLVKIGNAQMPGARQELIFLAKQLGIEDDILFLDQVSESDLVDFYNIADVFIFPSLYEGFGMPPLEAMACGCPVITSNVTSLPEVVGNAALTIEPTNIEDMANAMYRVLTEENLKEELVQNGYNRAKEFTWENSAQKLLQLYSEIDLI